MDLRNLIAKLDKIDQKQLLQEATNILSETRLHMKDIMAVADMPEDQRKQKLAQMASQYGKEGLFDPVNGYFVDTKGQYATIGAYKAEIDQLDRENLIPPKGLDKVSHFFGMMGKDRGEVEKTQEYAGSIEKKVSRASDLMKQALKKSVAAPSGAPSPSNATVDTTRGPKDLGKSGTANESIFYRTGIAQALTESFGYEFKNLLESITRDEHKELKKIMDELKDIHGDEDVAEVRKDYEYYNKKRDELIERIKELITIIKTKKGNKQVTKESIYESKNFLVENVTKNRVVLNESRVYIKEDKLFCVDPAKQSVLEFTLRYDEDDNLVEYVAEETTFKSAVDTSLDTGRGAITGLTFGWSDNAYAWLLSKYKGTPYGAELEKQLKATEAARERSPIMFNVGKYGSAFLLPGGLAVAGAQIAGQIGSGMIKPEMDADAINAAKKDHPDAFKNKTDAKDDSKNKGTDNKPDNSIGPFDPKVKVLQQQLMAAGFDVGIHKDDGRMGPDTRAAIAKAKAAGKLPADAEKITTPANKDTSNTGMAALVTALQGAGFKDTTPQNAIQNLQAYKKKIGAPSDIDALGKLMGVAPKEPEAEVKKESITFSSMTENERMAYLRNRLAQLEDTQLDEGFNPFAPLLKLMGLGEEAFLLKVASSLGQAELKAVTLGGKQWTKVADGLWQDAAGVTKAESEIVAGIKQEIKADGGVKFGAENGKPVQPGATPAPNAAPGANAAANAEAKANTSITDNQGTTWVKRGGGYWEAVAGKNKGMKVGKVKQPGLFASLEKEAGAEVQVGANASANATATAAVQQVKQAAPAVASRFQRMILNPASRVARFAWNNKLLSVLVGLGIASYLFGDDGNVETNNNNNNNNNQNVVHPNVSNKPDESDTTQEENELRNLLQQLRDGWPDDADAMIQAAEAVVPGIGGGTGNKPDSDPYGRDFIKMNKDISNGKLDTEVGIPGTRLQPKP